jgi:hypothetical protein
MARVALPQSKVRARRKKRRIVIASLIIAAVLLAFGGLVWLAHASFMRVSAVDVSGESTLQAADISNAVLTDLSGSYLYLFPKNNIFLYPKSKTEVALTEQMPTIAKVSINAKDFHTLSVTVTERARKALWCGTSVASASACFWLDQDGVAYAAASDLSLSLIASSTYEQYYGVLAGAALQHYLDTDQFHALSALVDALQQNQLTNTIQSVEVDGAGDVHVTFADHFVLLFSLSAAGADVYSRFQLVLGSDAFAGHSLADFEYVDLRFGDKIYYKLRDNLTPVIKSSQ